MFALIVLHSQRTLILVLLAVALFAAPGHAQMGLGLAPMRVDLNLAPGAVYSGVLTLGNSGAGIVRIKGEALDFYLDATATPQFGPEYAQEADYSCRTWLVANPMEAEFNTGSQIAVRYTVRVPQNATERSYHCALGFTTQPTAEEGKAIGLRTAVQIVAAIYVVLGKPPIEGTIKELKLEYVPDSKDPGWRAVVTLQNSGLMHFRPEGDLDVLNEMGAVVETVRFAPLPVLPKRDQKFVFPLKLTGGDGRYTLRARLDLGGNEIQEATASVVATKPKP
jgi:hypothetical protein